MTAMVRKTYTLQYFGCKIGDQDKMSTHTYAAIDVHICYAVVEREKEIYAFCSSNSLEREPTDQSPSNCYFCTMSSVGKTLSTKKKLTICSIRTFHQKYAQYFIQFQKHQKHSQMTHQMKQLMKMLDCQELEIHLPQHNFSHLHRLNYTSWHKVIWLTMSEI